MNEHRTVPVTETEAPTSTSPMLLWPLIDYAADKGPDRVFLTDDRGRSLTFAGFRSAAEGVAAWLQSEGIGPGTRVMWQLPTSLESAVLCAALARLGAKQNPLIPLLRVAEIAALDEQFDPQFAVLPTVWGDFRHADEVRQLTGPRVQVLVCDHREAGIGELALAQGDPASLPPAPTDDAPRWVYATSGSTARPKGILHSDLTLFAGSNGIVEQFGLTSEDLFPVGFPFAHIGGIVWLIASLRVGSQLLLLDTFDPARTPLVMAEHGATILGSATPFMQACLAAQRAHSDEKLYPHLRLSMTGGSPIPRDLDAQVRDELGGVGVVNGYGLTECPISGFPPLDDAAARADSAFEAGPLVSTRIVKADGSLAPDGEEGELCMDGPQKFLGYLDSALDADAFDDQGYVRTGDLAVRTSDGLHRITGRLKEIIIRNGENISIAEVEGVLATHPRIADVAITGLPDERRGQICCAVVSMVDDGEPLTLDEIAAHCQQAHLAKYKTPERLVVVPAIPRNSMGKIQRPAVAALVTEGSDSVGP